MKTYIIKNSDIMHGKKVFPEGSTIELDENDAVNLSDYLEEIKVSSLITDNVTLSVSSRAESRDEGSLITDHKSPITNNSLQKNKRSNK